MLRAALCSLSLQELGLLPDYLLALTTDDHLLRCAAQVCRPHRAASLWQDRRPRAQCELCASSVLPGVYEHCAAAPVSVVQSVQDQGHRQGFVLLKPKQLNPLIYCPQIPDICVQLDFSYLRTQFAPDGKAASCSVSGALSFTF